MVKSEMPKNVSVSDERDDGFPLDSQLPSAEKTRREKFLNLKDALFLWRSRTLKHSRSSTKGGETKEATIAIMPQVKENIRSGEAYATNAERPAAPDPDHGSSSNKKKISWRICRSLDASKIHGFENELMLVTNLFQRKEDHDGFKAIGIVGVQGIGKSTLCRLFLETPNVKRDYLPRLWISMSREFTEDQDPEAAHQDPEAAHQDPEAAHQGPKATLVKRILLCLGFEEKKLESICGNKNLSNLLYVLHLQLTGKRYLIVLDDVKESVDWLFRSESHLADGLPKGGGGRVIVTSRSSAVAKAMVGEKNIHQLLPFSDPESFWKIYEQEVKNCGSKNGSDGISSELKNGSDGVSSELENGSDGISSELKNGSDGVSSELKKELLEKCRGLPLAAKMLGDVKKADEAKKKLNERLGLTT